MRVSRFLYLLALILLPSAAGAAQPAVWASGKVVDETGRPVPGAHVELVSPKSAWDILGSTDPKRYGAASGADGRFRIPGVPADSWFSLGISQTGFTVLTADGIVTPRDGGGMELGTFRLPDDQIVAGRVVDARGRPLAGARVWARSGKDLQLGGVPPSGGPAAVTGPDGRFALHRFEPGVLEVCRRGLSPVQLTPQPSTLNRIVLTPPPPPSRISGRVIDDQGLPVAGAKVHLSSTDPWALLKVTQERHPCSRRDPDGELVALSDQEGRFTFELPGSETVNVWAEAAGFLKQEKAQVEHSPQKPGRVELVLQRGAVVSGRVFTAKGFPAANAEISISARRIHDINSARTDGEGRYRVLGVEPGDQTMEVRHPSGQARRKLAVARGENRRPDLTLDDDELREIRGRVTEPDGGPVAAADVRISSPAAFKTAVRGTSTGPDGSFRLSFRRGLSGADPIEVEAGKPGYRKRLLRLDPAAAFPDPLEIRLDPGMRLTGYVLGFDPERLETLSVEARQGEDHFTSKVSRNGEYRIAGLSPGDWTVTAEDYGMEEDAEPHCGAATITLEPGVEETVLNLRMLSKVKVKGRVLAPGGTPVDGAMVTFQNLDKDAPACAQVFVALTHYGSGGAFSTPMPEGRYSVLGDARDSGDYAPTVLKTPLTVAALPVEDLEVRLEPGGSLSGRLPGLLPEEADAVSIEATAGSVSRSAQASADGTYRLNGLRPGDWSVDAYLYRDRGLKHLEARVKLEPGQTGAHLDLDLVGERSLSLRFTSGDEPIQLKMRLSRSDSRGDLYDSVDLMNADRYRFSRLPAGRYRLRIEDQGHHRNLERMIDLSSDRELTIDLLNPEAP